VLHVLDSDGSSLAAQGWLEDVSKVTKYEMSEEDYASRDNTYRTFKEARLREDPGWSLEKEMCRRRGEDEAEALLWLSRVWLPLLAGWGHPGHSVR
jgi:tubulin-folding cofactor B